MATPKGYAHWMRTQSLMLIMLAVWVLFSFVFHACVETVDFGEFYGFEIGFLIAVQGSVIAFGAMLAWFWHRQQAIDMEYRVNVNE